MNKFDTRTLPLLCLTGEGEEGNGYLQFIVSTSDSSDEDAIEMRRFGLQALLAIAFKYSVTTALEKRLQLHRPIDWEGKTLKSKIDNLKRKVNIPINELADNNSCPVCTTGGTTKISGGIKNKWDILRANRWINNKGSRFGNWKDALLAQKEKANQDVSVDEIISALMTAAENYAAIANRTETYETDAAATVDSESTFAVDALALLQTVSSTSSNIAYSIADIIGKDSAATVGAVYAVVSSILSLLERVNLRVTSIILGYLNELSGSSTSVDQATVSTIMDILSPPDTDGGIFSDAVEYLKASGDSSGLIDVLTTAAVDVSYIQMSLSRFLTTADAFVLDANQSPSKAVMVQGDTILAITVALVGASVVSLFYFVLIISSSVAVILRFTIGSVINFFIAIIGLSVDNISLALDVYEAEGVDVVETFSTSHGEKAVQNDGDDYPCFCYGLFPLFVLIAIILSPIWFPLLLLQSIICEITYPKCYDSKFNSCQEDALVCQNDVLAAAIIQI